MKKLHRNLRIGIDVSTWICNATFGFSDMLADERHLSNYGRASLIAEQNRNEQNIHDGEETCRSNEVGDCQNDEEGLPKEVKSYIEKCTKYVMDRVLELKERCDAEVLVVFDGDKPPMKKDTVRKRRDARQEYERNRDAPINTEMRTDMDVEADIERRTRANRRAGAGKYMDIIITEIVYELKHLEVAFMFAPYESDGQLAFLSKENLIDLIITEDSDLIAHGARTIMFKSDVPRGQIIQITDIGALNPTMSSKNINFMDFSPVMLAALFVAAGCDYCEKLPGIGIVKATSAVRKAFLEAHKDSDSALSVIFSELYNGCNIGNLTAEFRKKYEEDFMKAMLMYRHPVVYDPTNQACVYVNDPQDGGGDIELLQYEPYMQLCQDKKRLAEAVGDINDPAREERVEGVGRERHPAFQNLPVLQVPANIPTEVEVPNTEPMSDDEDDDDRPDTQGVEPLASKRRGTEDRSQDEDMPDTQEFESSSSKQMDAEDQRDEGTQQSNYNNLDTQDFDPQASKQYDKGEGQHEGKDQEDVGMRETQDAIQPAARQKERKDLQEGKQLEDEDAPETQETGSFALGQGHSAEQQKKHANVGDGDQREPLEAVESQPENAGDTVTRSGNSNGNAVIELLSSDDEDDAEELDEEVVVGSNEQPIDLSQDDDDDADDANASEWGRRKKKPAPKTHPVFVASLDQSGQRPSFEATRQVGSAKRRAPFAEASSPGGRTKRRTTGPTTGRATPQSGRSQSKNTSQKERIEFV